MLLYVPKNVSLSFQIIRITFMNITVVASLLIIEKIKAKTKQLFSRLTFKTVLSNLNAQTKPKMSKFHHCFFSSAITEC